MKGRHVRIRFVGALDVLNPVLMYTQSSLLSIFTKLSARAQCVDLILHRVYP